MAVSEAWTKQESNRVRLRTNDGDPLTVAKQYVRSHFGFTGLVEVRTVTETGLKMLARIRVTANGFRYVFAEVG